MSDIANDSVVAPEGTLIDPGQEGQLPDDPVAQMTGFMAIRVTVEGRSRTLWQDIRSGEVLGYVDRFGRAVSLDGAFEARVVDGLLLDSPGSKGEEA